MDNTNLMMAARAQGIAEDLRKQALEYEKKARRCHCQANGLENMAKRIRDAAYESMRAEINNRLRGE